jgi:hypothetical protein
MNTIFLLLLVIGIWIVVAWLWNPELLDAVTGIFTGKHKRDDKQSKDELDAWIEEHKRRGSISRYINDRNKDKIAEIKRKQNKYKY